MRTLLWMLIFSCLIMFGTGCKKKLGYKTLKDLESVDMPPEGCFGSSSNSWLTGEYVIRSEAEFYSQIDTSQWAVCTNKLPAIDFANNTLFCACYEYNVTKEEWEAEMKVYYNDKKDDYDVFTKYRYVGGDGTYTTGCECYAVPNVSAGATVSFKSKAKTM